MQCTDPDIFLRGLGFDFSDFLNIFFIVINLFYFFILKRGEGVQLLVEGFIPVFLWKPIAFVIFQVCVGGGGMGWSPVTSFVSEHASYLLCQFFSFQLILSVPVILLNHIIKSATVY